MAKGRKPLTTEVPMRQRYHLASKLRNGVDAERSASTPTRRKLDLGELLR